MLLCLRHSVSACWLHILWKGHPLTWLVIYDKKNINNRSREHVLILCSCAAAHIVQCLPAKVPMTITCRPLEVVRTDTCSSKGCLYSFQVSRNTFVNCCKQWLQVSCTAPHLAHQERDVKMVCNQLLASAGTSVAGIDL